MDNLTELKKLLQDQFGAFIREDHFKKAFDEAIQILDSIHLPSTITSKNDIFYLYLHHLLLYMLNKMDDLEKTFLSKA